MNVLEIIHRLYPGWSPPDDDVIVPDEIWLPGGPVLVRAPDGSNDTYQIEIEHHPIPSRPREGV